MKHLLAALCLLLTSVAPLVAAEEPGFPDILETLIRDAPKLQLIDNSNGEPFSASLIAILVSQLLSGSEDETGVYLAFNRGKCSQAANDGETERYDCEVVFGNSDYEQTEKGLEGPLAESAYILNFVFRRRPAFGREKLCENGDVAGCENMMRYETEVEGNTISVWLAG